MAVEVKIVLTTFNVAEKEVRQSDFDTIFQKASTESPNIDLVVLGMQEAQHTQSSRTINGFTRKYHKHLGIILSPGRAQYQWIYVRDGQDDRFHRVNSYSYTAPIKLAKHFGGKGGVIQIIECYATTGDRRTNDPTKKLRLGFISTHLHDKSAEARTMEVESYLDVAKDEKCEVTFLMGDLNYRCKLKGNLTGEALTMNSVAGQLAHPTTRRQLLKDTDTLPTYDWQVKTGLFFPPPVEGDYAQDWADDEAWEPIYPSYNRKFRTIDPVPYYEQPENDPLGRLPNALAYGIRKCYFEHQLKKVADGDLQQDRPQDVPYNDSRGNVADMGWLDRIGWATSMKSLNTGITVTPKWGAGHNEISRSDHMPVSLMVVVKKE